jgi:small conductance mechanosensitive channel
MTTPAFDLDVVLQRLLSEAYGLIAALPLLALALLAVWVCWMLGGWLSRRSLLDRVAQRNPFMRDLTRTTVRWGVTLLGVLVALEIMNATALVGALLGTAGVLGVALGFAFKDTLENYLAGILMSLRQPFSPRDHVVIDGNEGVVVSMTSRATILMTLDGNHLRLPNALVFRSVTLNYTRNPSRRFEFEVGIGVGEDLVAAQHIGTEQLSRLAGVAQTPPPRAYIAALGDSNVQVRFLGWVDQRSHDFLMVRSEAIRTVKLALEAAGMDMPEPIYRVQLSDRAGGLSTATASPPAPPRPARAPSTQGPVNTGAIDELSPQIDAEPKSDDSTDLLDPRAPKE